MVSSQPKPKSHAAPSDTSAAVDAFMSGLEHPCKPEIEALRQIILRADPAIEEGIKWKAPSFRTGEYFATMHLRLKGGVGLILHLGAKVRDLPSVPVDDPEGRLKWLARDRAMLTFTGLDELRSSQAAVEHIVRQWITFL